MKLTSTCFLTLLLLHSITAAHAQETAKTDTTQKEHGLKEVTIKAQQNVIETAPGKTIVNVQAMSGNAGKNVLELLRKLPGVSVDGQGNISMAGKQGVLIMIDGRQTYLSGDDLKDYLQGLTAEEVKQIELITQPSAHYDAEGNAGIINIKMSKIKKQGFNGSINTVYSRSKYDASHNTLLLNYRKNKINLFTSINYLNAAGTVDWRNDLQFKDAAGNTSATSSIHSVPVERFAKWNVMAGADYSYSDNTTIGISFTGAYYSNTMHSLINTINDNLVDAPVISDRNTTESSLRRNAGCSMYLKHSFSKKSELNINLDYLLFTRIMSQYLNTDATQNGIGIPGQLVLRSQLPINIQVWSAKADHSLTLDNGIKIESGGKLSYIAVDNTGLYNTLNNGSWQYDSSRTNHFIYHEHIAALYVNTVKKINDKWDAQLGLRGEMAQIQGRQEATGQVFSRDMPALFPTAYLSYKPDSNNALELSYGRRVERPRYSMLNPFNYYTFYNTYQRGNPELLPQYSHNIELKHVYKNKLTTSVELSMVTNNITDVTVADNQAQTTYGIPINFGTTKYAGIGIAYNTKPRPWWELMINLRGGYVGYKGMYNNAVVSSRNINEGAWINNQFTYGKWSAELWASYNSTSASSPVSEDKGNVYMNMGVSRKMLRDTIIVKVSVDDPFNIFRNATETVQPGLYSLSTLKPMSRFGALSVTYNFGKAADKHTTHKSNGPDEATRM